MSIIRQERGLPPSLLDVFLVILMLFIMLSALASVAEREAKEMSLPPIDLAAIKDGGQTSPGLTRTKPVTITVAPGPQFFLDAAKMDFDQLKNHLSKNRIPEVELRGDSQVPYGQIMRVLRLCRETGNTRVAITYKADQN